MSQYIDMYQDALIRLANANAYALGIVAGIRDANNKLIDWQHVVLVENDDGTIVDKSTIRNGMSMMIRKSEWPSVECLSKALADYHRAKTDVHEGWKRSLMTTVLA
ncbi:hypothetical protein BH11PLA2_BH11PLA2_40950 [soil metagenome]